MPENTVHWTWDTGREQWTCRAHRRRECLACDLDPGVERSRLLRPKRPGTVRLAGQKLSVVGDQGPAGLQCPNCGSTNFTAKRSFMGKVALGVLAPKTKVKCVVCGTSYQRG